MRNLNKFKKLGSKLLCGMLVAALVAEVFPSIEKETTVVEAASFTKVTGNRIRGVVNDIDELPQYGLTDEQLASKIRGSKDRPFFILEVSPHEENGEFGYLIGGCEPVKVEEMCGASVTPTGAKTTYFGAIGSMNTADIHDTTKGYLDAANGVYNGGVLFFTDELEANVKYYNNLTSWSSDRYVEVETNVRGYYEYVGPNKGNYVSVEVAALKYEIQSVTPGTGDLVWHTVNDFLYATLPYSKVTYDTLDYPNLKQSSLDEIGERYYTYRARSASDKQIDVAGNGYYKTYVNNENFLKLSLELTDEEAANYSCLIKTISVADLNANPEWIKYADLIYILPAAHNGNIVDTYRLKSAIDDTPLNRVGKTPRGYNEDKDDLSSFGKTGNDLYWEVTYKIFEKVNADTNFAALILDNNVYEKGQYSTVKHTYSQKIYDYNNKYLGKKDGAEGYAVNVLKLAYLNLSLNPNLIKNLYFKTGIIDPATGKDTRQDSRDAIYWTDYTFAIMNPGSDAGNIYSLTYNETYWQAFNGTTNLTQEDYKSYVYNRTYTYKGNSSIAMLFASGTVGASETKYDEFNDFMTDPNNQTYSNGRTSNTAYPADAIRYILGNHKRMNFDSAEGLRVLDIEPGVALKNEKETISGTDGKSWTVYKKDWQLTESDVQLFVPNYTGDITITHMTTNEFVGKVSDLVSEYDLIYIGADYQAYNLRNNKEYISDSNGIGANYFWTDYNDSRLDGKRYYHIGDSMKRNNIGSVDFISGSNNNDLYYPGNDISKLKYQELLNYISGGSPIVMAHELYDTKLKDKFVTSDSYIYALASQAGVFDVNMTRQIEDVLVLKSYMPEITNVPTIYKGNVSESGGVVSISASYISKLVFSYKIDKNDPRNYGIHIYVDKDRDGKFTSTEIIASRDATKDGNEYRVTYNLDKSLMGIIQWKMEIYDKDNPNFYVSETGVSAMKLSASAQKKKINVLQITPDCDPGNSYNNLNLETDSTFKKYYSNLEEFTVKVRVIKYKDFEDAFKQAANNGRRFKFNIGKAVCLDSSLSEAEQNPIVNNLTYLENIELFADGELRKLSDFNMIVVGFGDEYGKIDVSNEYGAAEYLSYWALNGKSILFTHDNTSFFNVRSEGNPSGYTPNAYMRDLMGMNRYKMVSKFLSSDTTYFRSGLKDELVAYQSNHNTYDTITGAMGTQTQGWTVWALHRIGSGSSPANGKQPYKYSIYYPDGTKTSGNDTGYANTNNITSRVEQVNQGQITSYPYLIQQNIKVSDTHSQYYQINVEDPDVTVWYTLSDSGTSSSVIEAASPRDTVNNYYIYSKGNIFYSGVGHSKITGAEEAKLFVNTMIAAYRQSYSAPHVEITNSEAIEESVAPYIYKMQILREYTANASGGNDAEDFSTSSEKIRIYFTPVDGSLSDELFVRIKYDGTTNYITTIYRKSDGQSFTAGTDNFIPGLKNGLEYYFDYPKSLLDSQPDIVFDVKNNASPDIGNTDLLMRAQPIFLLD